MYDSLNTPTLLTYGTIPSLLPLKSQRRVESTFGIIHDRPGGHAILSEETLKNPDFAKLLSRWTTKFSQDWLCDTISFCTATIMQTQDACFTSTDNTVGVVMIVDTSENDKTGGYYIINSEGNSTISTHASNIRPLLLTSGLQSYLPQAYSEAKVVIRLDTPKGYQTTPRRHREVAMNMGYGTSRFTGACFQGLVSADLTRFQTNINNNYLDCERTCKSIISDSDLDSTACQFPAWGQQQEIDDDSNSEMHNGSVHNYVDDYPGNNKQQANIAVKMMADKTKRSEYPGSQQMIDRENIRQFLNSHARNHEHAFSTKTGFLCRNIVSHECTLPDESLELAREDSKTLEKALVASISVKTQDVNLDSHIGETEPTSFGHGTMEIENLLQQESIAKDGTTPYAERIFYYNPEEESEDMYNSHTREVEQTRIEIGRSYLDQHPDTEKICALAAFSVTHVHTLSYNHSLWIANVENTSLEPTPTTCVCHTILPGL